MARVSADRALELHTHVKGTLDMPRTKSDVGFVQRFGFLQLGVPRLFPDGVQFKL